MVFKSTILLLCPAAQGARRLASTGDGDWAGSLPAVLMGAEKLPEIAHRLRTIDTLCSLKQGQKAMQVLTVR